MAEDKFTHKVKGLVDDDAILLQDKFGNHSLEESHCYRNDSVMFSHKGSQQSSDCHGNMTNS
jgi:hypothetical protein